MPLMPHFPIAATLVATILAGPAAADPLAAHLWKDRVLLVLASDGTDARLDTQRAIFRRMGGDARERDLKLVEMVGDTPAATAARRRFGVGPGFHALLIGKDGGAKLAADTPLEPEALLPLIDTMPMRRDEMRQRS